MFLNPVDWIIAEAWDGLITWLYSKVLEFLNDFLVMMGGMGAEIFDLDWIKAIVRFFYLFGWALFAVGLVVAVFDTAIEYQGGRGSIKDNFLNVFKGLMAVTLFTTTPVELYRFCVTLQSTFGREIIGILGESAFDFSSIAANSLAFAVTGSTIFLLFAIIMTGYCIVKVFFASLKRGGILIITIAVGSMYMFSVPRGYMDGFISWCKQVFALCLTAFLQTTVLIAGLITFRNNMLLGLGIMLSATEIPRIAGAFGLDTSTKVNVMSSVYTAQAAVNVTRQMISKIK